LARAAEWLVDFGRSLVSVVVLDELYIHRLVGPNAHEVKRSTALSDHLKISRVLGVVEASERSIFDAETILPEM
jgi:hypothetical protein